MLPGGLWTGSIRFRLAAWFALIVLAVLVAMGIVFSILLERELRNDVDTRIEATARRVKNDIENVYIDPRTGEFSGIIRNPPPDFYSFPSLLIQVVNTNDRIYVSSQNLEQPGVSDTRLLPTADAPAGSIEPVFRTAELSGVPVRTVKLPLVVTDGGERRTVGAVNVGEPLIQLEQTLDHIRRLLFVGAFLAVAFAAIAGWFLAGRALRPVDRITATAAAIAAGRGVGQSLAARLEVGRSGDELARLSATFNRMLNSLQETFESQRRFLADASHELRTPLTAIRGNVDVLSRQLDLAAAGPEVGETITDLRRESERMGRLVEDLLLLARAETAPSDEDRRSDVALEELVAEAIRVGGALATGQEIIAEAPSSVRVHADRDRLLQVLLILIDNAIRHTPEDGNISVSALIERGRPMLRVSDTGAGIPEEHLPHLFGRFYRADVSRQRGSGGTGLGLAIARAIVESHGGTIAVESRVGEGTTFTVSLPRISPGMPRIGP